MFMPVIVNTCVFVIFHCLIVDCFIFLLINTNEVFAQLSSKTDDVHLCRLLHAKHVSEF